MKNYKNELIKLLAGLVVISTATTTVHAIEVEEIGKCDEYSMCDDFVTPDGFYAYCTTTNGVHEFKLEYLGNDVENTIETKSAALSTARSNYGTYYLHEKTIENPAYYPFTDEPEFITLYIASDSKSISGWTKIYSSNLSSTDLVYSSLELAEFCINLLEEKYEDTNGDNVYITNPTLKEDTEECANFVTPDGFYAYCTTTNGVHEFKLEYLGNDVANTIETKTDALATAKSNYGTYYLFKKVIVNPNFIEGTTSEIYKYTTLYVAGDKTSISGWTRIYSSDLSTTDIVYSSVELANFCINYMEQQKESVVAPEETPDDNNYQSTHFYKEKAYNYARTYYGNFCVVSKLIDNPYDTTTDLIRIYSISTTPFVSGWDITADNEISTSQVIFISPEYADNYYGISNTYTLN